MDEQITPAMQRIIDETVERLSSRMRIGPREPGPPGPAGEPGVTADGNGAVSGGERWTTSELP